METLIAAGVKNYPFERYRDMGDGRGSELMDIWIERAASHLREVNLAALL
ncbi:MAG: hypothetical protein IIC90_12225 [Chloroflexi bacterium]|nr:hypothetical protein [Chloroflexota bacterium]